MAISTDPLWYKDAVVYQLHVKAFFDSNDDGLGDFRGLTQKLDYLQELGVNALWLLPFYPSPLRDDGYDISDYRKVNPSYGTMRDFRVFLREAHRRGLRVITELVVNHTSDQHPWFQAARRARPGSARRDFYVWSDGDGKYGDARIIFTDSEQSNWSWDPEAKAYYWHRFFSHQPDLNFANPRVVEAMINTMRYWLDMGVDGFRLDAIPYLCEREGTSCENLPETHDVVKRLRAALDERYTDRVFVAEANQWPEDVRPYFGDGDECHMAYHFPLMPRIYMALAQEDRHPVTDIMRQTPEIPASCQWAIFLRNHDELTLEMVTDSERDYLWRFYAEDPRARINVGIRRRLAPLLDNDRRKVEQLNILLMSMPGTPIIYYGDEIGMGDNVFLGDRNAVRTPMQWTPDRNGGFSKANPASLYLPAIMDPVYGYAACNVEAQSQNPSSLLNWVKRLIAVRKNHPVFGRGRIRFLYPGNRKVLAYLREDDNETVLCIVNLSRAPQPVELDLSEFKDYVPVELLGRSPFPPVGELPYFITLGAYGFYWFLLAEEAEAPSWHEAVTPPLPELLTLVAPNGWESLGAGEPRELLETRALPEFLANQRWFGGKAAPIAQVRQHDRGYAGENDEGWAFLIYGVVLGNGENQYYAVPQAVDMRSAEESDSLTAAMPWTLARVRRGPRLGVLVDATADGDFARDVVRWMRDRRAIATDRGGTISGDSAGQFHHLMEDRVLDKAEVHRLGQEQSNTSVRFGDSMVLKFYRRLQPGAHPEVEMSRYLSEATAFANTPPMLGALEYREGEGPPTALALLQGYVRNQGDGWTYVTDYLDRALDLAEVQPEGLEGDEANVDAPFLTLMEALGRRTAEMHRALATETHNPAFAPDPVRASDLRRLRREARAQVRKAFTALRRAGRSLPEDLRAEAAALSEKRGDVFERIDALVPERLSSMRTRCHGDYHLGQVVLAHNDFFILDFEGEPARALDERRRKQVPLVDVAGMLRSFDYAGQSALFNRVEPRPSLDHRLVERIRQWHRDTATAFMGAYLRGIEGCSSMPDDREAATRLIRLFMVEKACYEICYEAANRPRWLHVPLRGLRSLLDDEGRAPWLP